MQSKSISTSSANAFDAKNADILPFSIRWIHNCMLLLNDDISSTSKSILPFTCLELFSWFKHKKSPKKIWQSTCCRWIVQQRYDSVLLINTPVPLRGPLSPTSFLKRQRIFKNKTNVHCVLPTSHHTYKMRKGRLLMWLTADENYLKAVRSWISWLSDFFSTLKTLTTSIFLFSFFINSLSFFLFWSWPNKHHRHKQTRSDFAKVGVTQWRILLS